MSKARDLPNTADRMEGLRQEAFALLGMLDEPAGREFEVITTIAARQLGCRTAAVSLIDATNQHFLSGYGLAGASIPRRDSFCTHALEADETLVVPDAALDPRFRDNPLVVGPPHIRFYAGVPLYGRSPDGRERVAIGSLCVSDDAPREFDARDRDTLDGLAAVAEALIEARAAARKMGALVERSQSTVEALSRERRVFEQAERLASLGSWRLTFEDERLVWSDQVYAIHEVPLGTPPPPLGDALAFYPPEARQLVSASVEHTMSTGEPFEFETDLVTALGNRRRVRSMGELEIIGGKPVALVGVFQDVTHAYELQETLRRIASTDELTGLANRAECNRVLDAAILAARAGGTELALLLIDLDGFKSINDRCGHLAGDVLLRRIGQRLRLPYLADAFAARLGGDEFVVLVSAPKDCEDFDTLVARLLSDLRDTIPHADGTLPVSGTIGISWLDASVEDRSDFLQRADIALYAAKKRQRGTAETFNRAAARAKGG